MLNLEQPPANTQHYELLACSAQRSYTTPAGTIYLRDRCPASFVRQLSADKGLHSFARRPEREYELLLNLVQSGRGELALAYTDEGAIIGQITIADVDTWWSGIDMIREAAIEVSVDWRKLGVARWLIELVMAREDLEDWILLAMGFSWHWETEQLGLPRMRYRELLARLVAPYGFLEYLTVEPNIRDDPANILLARLGSRVEQSVLQQFYARLLSVESMLGPGPM